MGQGLKLLHKWIQKGVEILRLLGSWNEAYEYHIAPFNTYVGGQVKVYLYPEVSSNSEPFQLWVCCRHR